MAGSESTKKRSIIERLEAGEVIIGDAGYVMNLERRGYVQAGPWTPEVVLEHPNAVRELHREFARSGSDLIQALTFYCSDDKLEISGRSTAELGSMSITRAACQLAREVADEFGGLLVAASISQTPSYLQGKGKQVVQDLVRRQAEVHKEMNVDVLIIEYFQYCEEICWCIEAAKEFGIPIAASMCIGPDGDVAGVSAADCAVGMAKAGADIVGVNCHYDPYVSMRTMRIMREALDNAGLKPHLMCQPLGFMTSDLKDVNGYTMLNEYPLCMESRLCNRFDFSKFARDAYDLGVRFLGACCGAESVHIREMAVELAAERGRYPISYDKMPNLTVSSYKRLHERQNKDYWLNLQPASGRQA